MGWKIEDLVCQESRSSVRQFECNICMCIWDDPVEVPCCANVFCRECIGRCAACPLCKLPLKDAKPPSKFVIRMLNDIPVACPYSTGEDKAPEAASSSGQQPEPAVKRQRRCDADRGCGWRGSYGDFLGKHLQLCGFHPVECPNGCGAKVPRHELDQHNKVCAKNFCKCEICGEVMKPDAVAQHTQAAAQLHVRMLQDSLTQAKERQSKAEAEKVNQAAVLAALMELMRKQQQHITNITKTRGEEIKAIVRQCTSEVKSCVRGEDATDVKISLPASMSNVQANAKFTSEPINLGARTFVFEVYPNGHPQWQDGGLVFGLHATEDTGACTARFGVKVDGVYEAKHKLSFNGPGSGATFKGPALEDFVAASQEGCVTVGLRLFYCRLSSSMSIQA